MTATSRIRSFVVTGLLTVLFVSVGTPANASDLPVPGVPIIEIISASAASGGTVSVTVRVYRPSARPSSPVQSMHVRIGGRPCDVTMLVWKWRPGDAGPYTECTLPGIASRSTVNVSARGRNQFGFGSWSKPIRFVAKPGAVWNRPNNK